MPYPDLILHSGNIIVLDRGSRLAQAISVRSGRVMAVGDDAALLKEAAPTTQLINLEGRSVLPDSSTHIHMRTVRVSRREAAFRLLDCIQWRTSSMSLSGRRKQHQPANGSC